MSIVKIFSAAQIKAWDQYTIQHEPIASVELMERAASRCAEWILSNTDPAKEIIIFCGPGNNGGDGLAITRLLFQHGRTPVTYILDTDGNKSADYTINAERLASINQPLITLKSADDFPLIETGAVIIDALYGYGLNRPLSGLPEILVNFINRSGATIVSIDMPSGLFADKTSVENTVIQAQHTLTFQTMKLAFLLPENAAHVGEVQVLDINLHQQYYKDTPVAFEIIPHALIHSLYEPRKKFSHKGSYGNAALIAGSYGMMGAAVLASKACMRSGAGKLTCYIPGCGYTVLQTASPETMCVTDENQAYHTALHLKGKYDAYAIGPGMGQHNETSAVLQKLLAQKPEHLIIDADGLNLLSTQQHLYQQLPPGTILTPHPKEFERLFSSTANHFDRLELALQKAKELGVYILIKGNYSFIATPGGKGYFNPTGNPGMATAGSGDVLTGILLGLYAQQHNAESVLLMGVYLHGLAGDLAARDKTEEAMVAGDIIEYIPVAYAAIKKPVYFG